MLRIRIIIVLHLFYVINVAYKNNNIFLICASKETRTNVFNLFDFVLETLANIHQIPLKAVI